MAALLLDPISRSSSVVEQPFCKRQAVGSTPTGGFFLHHDVMGAEIVTDKPKFVHDCDKCRFIATIGGLDIYICGEGKPAGPSIIARYGDDGPQYTSMPIRSFRWLMRQNKPVEFYTDEEQRVLPMREYLLSNACVPEWRAWLVALAMEDAQHADQR